MLDPRVWLTACRRANPGVGSPPSDVAEVLYTAATDGTDRLRYPAGANAADFLALRNGKTDEEYVAATRQQLGLEPSR